MSATQATFTENPAWSRIKAKDEAITDDDANFAVDQFSIFKDYQQAEDRKHAQHTIKSAIATIEKLIVSLSKIGYNVEDVYLRFDTRYRVTALVLVNMELFFSEEFDAAYLISREIEASDKKDFFEIKFSFAAKTEDLFEHNISCEGFVLKRNVVVHE